MMVKDFSHPQVVANYDDHIIKLIPAYLLMHQQVRSILKVHFSTQAHFLIVGCGTGYELQYLLAHFPDCKITAVDPSANMLKQAQKNIQSLSNAHQVRFILGHVERLVFNENFDAILCLLVVHFVPFDHKALFFKQLYRCLKPQGILLTYDLGVIETQQEHDILQYVCQEQGLSLQQAQAMSARLEDDFALICSDQYQDLLLQSGFIKIKIYLNVLNYVGFFAQK